MLTVSTTLTNVTSVGELGGNAIVGGIVGYLASGTLTMNTVLI